MGLGSSVTGVSEPCWLVVSYSVGLSGEGGLCDGFGSGGEGGTIPRAGFPVVVGGFVGGEGCYGERSVVGVGGGGLSRGRWFSG